MLTNELSNQPTTSFAWQADSELGIIYVIDELPNGIYGPNIIPAPSNNTNEAYLQRFLLTNPSSLS